MNLLLFMSSAAGRIIRIMAGVGLALWGYSLSSTAGWLVVIVGVIIVAAGLFDFCLFAPLFAMPFSGSGIRAKKNARE
jgi:hypothetical protein